MPDQGAASKARQYEPLQLPEYVAMPETRVNSKEASPEVSPQQNKAAKLRPSHAEQPSSSSAVQIKIELHSSQRGDPGGDPTRKSNGYSSLATTKGGPHARRRRSLKQVEPKKANIGKRRESDLGMQTTTIFNNPSNLRTVEFHI